jgi:hypothetical protein
LVLRHNTRKRHSLIVAQGHFVAAMGLEAIDQFLVVADLAFQRLRIFDDRRLERLEAVALEHADQGIDDVLPQDHRLRQVIAHAFDILGLVAHKASCLCNNTCGYDTICRCRALCGIMPVRPR